MKAGSLTRPGFFYYSMMFLGMLQADAACTCSSLDRADRENISDSCDRNDIRVVFLKRRTKTSAHPQTSFTALASHATHTTQRVFDCRG
jgi:gluconate kinase